MVEQLVDLTIFDLAPWPVVCVDAAALVRYSNGAAKKFFGDRLVEGASMSAFWTSENELTCQSLFTRASAAGGLTTNLRLRGNSVAITAFNACASKTGDELVLQLIPAAQAPKPNEARPQSVEVNLAQKQKLDCALQLTRTVALDFNNTLTAILGHTTHLLSTTEPAHPFRKSLTEVEKAAERAAEVANQLAAFSSDQKEALAQTSGNINGLLRRTVELFQTPQHVGLAWALNFEPRIFSVNFDEAKMQQAFVKVLENAVQAVDPHGRISVQTRNVELTTATQDRTAYLAAGTYVCVEITDNGCGIEPAVLPRVFEPFFTTKYGHRGLGLAWVYGIATNHGGGVSISSQLAHGTSVRIYLPAMRKVVEERTIVDSDLNGKETVLVVDDEEMVLTMAEMVLKSRGYRVLTALSGEKGLEVFAKTQSLIDLLITDMVMPKMNGRELIEKVRVISPKTKVVCATACNRSIKIEKALDFLPKPFTAQDLLRKVRETLSATSD